MTWTTSGDEPLKTAAAGAAITQDDLEQHEIGYFCRMFAVPVARLPRRI